MRGKNSVRFRLRLHLLAIITLTLFVTSTCAAAEKVLYSFCRLASCPDGAFSQASLTFDVAGNLYGTTTTGGTYSQGTVFELTPTVGGAWAENVVHNFTNNGSDGYFPGASLVFDAAGNLYGTTEEGGAYQYGTVFELTPTTGGGWTEKVLHSFNANGKDGFYPVTSLIFDTSGNLYGVAIDGGAFGGGTAFELTPTASGGWAERVLHSFEADGIDGQGPTSGLTFDAAGSLYGTTYFGGTHGGGTVFKLTRAVGGGWAETILYNFNDNGTDGLNPDARPILDPAGNLYGTTYDGGSGTACTGGCGTVFELIPMAGGDWEEKVLHSFNNNGKDGFTTTAGVVIDAVGNLFGTTYDGGNGTVCTGGCGTVFEMTETTGGIWVEKVLHNFNLNGHDGGGPAAGLIFDTAGNLYGTTYFGGAYGEGTVFELKP